MEPNALLGISPADVQAFPGSLLCAVVNEIVDERLMTSEQLHTALDPLRGVLDDYHRLSDALPTLSSGYGRKTLGLFDGYAAGGYRHSSEVEAWLAELRPAPITATVATTTTRQVRTRTPTLSFSSPPPPPSHAMITPLRALITAESIVGAFFLGVSWPYLVTILLFGVIWDATS